MNQLNSLQSPSITFLFTFFCVYRVLIFCAHSNLKSVFCLLSAISVNAFYCDFHTSPTTITTTIQSTPSSPSPLWRNRSCNLQPDHAISYRSRNWSWSVLMLLKEIHNEKGNRKCHIAPSSTSLLPCRHRRLHLRDEDESVVVTSLLLFLRVQNNTTQHNTVHYHGRQASPPRPTSTYIASTVESRVWSQW